MALLPFPVLLSDVGEEVADGDFQESVRRLRDFHAADRQLVIWLRYSLCAVAFNVRD